MKYVNEKNAVYLIDKTGLIGCRIYDSIVLSWKENLYLTFITFKINLVEYDPSTGKCYYWKQINGKSTWYYSDGWLDPHKLLDKEINYTYIDSLVEYIREEALYGLYIEATEVYAPPSRYNEISEFVRVVKLCQPIKLHLPR